MGYRGNGNKTGIPGGDDLLNKVNETLNKAAEQFRGKGGGPVAMIIGAIILLFGLLGSFYTVEPEEEAVVVRLGKYQSTYPPGLHFKMPFGMDQVFKVKTKRILKEEFGFRTQSDSGRRSTYAETSFDEESLMLTGDLNVADVEWVVQYQVADPFKFLFQIRDPVITIRDISMAVMRRVVGDRAVSDVLTTGRVEIASEAQRLSQELLDKYDIGIQVVAVKLQDVNPPEVVKPAFNEVNAAKQEQEKAINMAEEQYNKVVPEAAGRAEKTVSEAEGFSSALFNRAKGDADKFTAMLKEYRRAPAVTRKRMYLETMEELFEKFGKITIIDADVKGVLPVFGGRTLGAAAVEGGAR